MRWDQENNVIRIIIRIILKQKGNKLDWSAYNDVMLDTTDNTIVSVCVFVFVCFYVCVLEFSSKLMLVCVFVLINVFI